MSRFKELEKQIQMKKLFFTALLLFTVVCTQAQEFGINAGFVQQTVRERQTKKGKLVAGDPLHGFKVGVVFEQQFKYGLGLASSLNYSYFTKQGSWKQDSGITSTRRRTAQNAHYLDLPIHLQYRLNMAKDTYFIFYTGPILNYGLSNETTTYEKTISNESKSSIDYFDGNSNYAPRGYHKLNLLWGVGVGLQYQKFQLKGGYDFGLTNSTIDSRFTALETNPFYKRSRLDEWTIKLTYFF